MIVIKDGKPEVAGAIDSIPSFNQPDVTVFVFQAGRNTANYNFTFMQVSLPLEALLCANHNAAEVLNEIHQRGTLEHGKRADLILLSADPLEDIRNSTRIKSIFNGGTNHPASFPGFIILGFHHNIKKT